MKLKFGFVVGLGLLASWAAFGLFMDNAPSRGKPSLQNRLWTDHLPKNQTDLTIQLALVSKAGQKMGVVGQTSAWRVHLDRVRWSTKGDKLTLEFPQMQNEVTVKYRVFECKGSAPRPFDLCLEISNKGRKTMLYSKRARPWKRGEAIQTMLDEPMPEAPAPNDHAVESIPVWLR